MSANLAWRVAPTKPDNFGLDSPLTGGCRLTMKLSAFSC